MSTNKEQFMRQAPDPEKQRIGQLMRRDDLATSFGLVLRVPFHGVDEMGQPRYGLPPTGGTKNPDITAQFQSEMRQIIVESAGPLVAAGLLTEAQVGSIESHPYETGPAAGDWWQFFFPIFDQVGPWITRSAEVIAIADFIKQVAEGITEWRDRKREEIARDGSASLDQNSPFDPDPHPVVTLPGLVALCKADLLQRYQPSGDIGITVFPRNRWVGYGSANHPGMGETYVIRLTAGGSDYYYILDGHGKASEHFRMSGAEFEMLVLPGLIPSVSSGNEYHQPDPPLHFNVLVSPQASQPPELPIADISTGLDPEICSSE